MNNEIFLIKKDISCIDYKEAENYFKEWYLKQIKHKQNFNESLISRYLISKVAFDKYNLDNFLPNIDKFWTPIFDMNLFWSISHKHPHILKFPPNGKRNNSVVFVWVSKSRIWVDIEIFKQRDENILSNFSDWEYSLFWWKNFENFYFLWTAKESTLKYFLLGLDYINIIKLTKLKKIKKNISDIEFCYELFFEFDRKIVCVYSWKEKDVFYSICNG